MTIPQIFYALLRPGLSHPENLIISDEGTNGMHALKMYAHPADMPRLVGKKGAMLEALNDIGAAIGTATGEPVRLALMEAEDPPPRNRLFNQPARWSTDWARTGIQACLDAAGTGCRASFIDRPGHASLMIAPAVPLGIAGPLERWLGVMGHQGGVRLSMDATTV